MQGCSAYVVGGFLRDLMLHGLSASPRDIDIVFEGASPDKIEYLFWNNKERKNRFGGMRLKLGNCPFDVWSLGDTWAFRHEKIDRVEVSVFPRTTFLNLDAIAYRWRENSEDEIYSNGFFEGILTRTLEINLEENPFPETCVVRSLMLASMLNFAIGPKLAAYISLYSKKVSLKELQRVQSAHYGFVELDGDDLRACLKAINGQLRRSKESAVRLPERQLKLDRPNSKRKRENKLRAWISRIAEIAFVHTRPARRLQSHLSATQYPTINILNIQQQWLKKIS